MKKKKTEKQTKRIRKTSRPFRDRHNGSNMSKSYRHRLLYLYKYIHIFTFQKIKQSNKNL